MKDQTYNCLGCGYVGKQIGDKDMCAVCQHEYAPNQDGNGEDCPECGSPHYDNTCPECGTGGGTFGPIETTHGFVNKKEYRAMQAAQKGAPQS